MDSINPAALDTPRRPVPWLGYAIGLAATGAILAAAMLTAKIDPAFAGAVHFRPHLPDLALLARQSAVVQLHVYAALVAVGLGALMMTSIKGRAFHRIAGWVWVSIMLVVAGSSLFITGLNGYKWSFIHLFSGWTLVAAPLALIAARRHKIRQHRRMMMGLFYFGVLIAGALAFIPGRLMWNIFF